MLKIILHFLIKNEFPIDIESKMNSFQKLRNILEENKSKIYSVLDNKKAKIFVSFKNLKNITKFYDCISFFRNSGILYYGEITIEIEKDWFGIFFTIFLGVCEIVAGSFLSGIGLGSLGIDLMNEGFEDIKYGFECLVGEKQFSWKELGNRKMAFVIKVATSYTLKWIFKGFKNPFKRNDLKNSKDYFNLVKKKAVEIGTQKLVNYTINKCLGPKFFEAIIQKLKEFSKKISKFFFENHLKDILIKRYKNQIKQMLILDLLSEKNNWNQALCIKMKVSLNCLSRIIGTIVKTILNLMNSLLKNDSWENKLTEIFKNLIECGIDELKKALEDSLSIAKDTFLEIFKGFEQKAIKGIKNVLYTFDDIMGRMMNITNVKELTNTLINNDLISKFGEINGKLVFNDMNYIPKINFKFPMDILLDVDLHSNILNNVPNLDSKFLTDKLDNISDNIKNIKNINNIYNNLFDNFADIDKLMSNNMKNMKNLDPKLIVDKLDKISENITNVSNINNIFNNLNSKFDEIKDIYLNYNIMNNIPNLDSNFLSDKLNNISENIKNVSNIKNIDINNDLIKKFSEIKEKLISNNMNNISNLDSKFLTDKINNISDNIKNVANINNINNICNNLINKYDEIKSNFLSNILNKIPKIDSNYITNKLDNIPDNIKNITNINDINLGEFNSKKNVIIKQLKTFQKKIDDFDIDKKIDKIISELNICMDNEVMDIILEALNDVEVLKFLKTNIKNAKEIIDKASDSLQNFGK